AGSSNAFRRGRGTRCPGLLVDHRRHDSALRAAAGGGSSPRAPLFPTSRPRGSAGADRQVGARRRVGGRRRTGASARWTLARPLRTPFGSRGAGEGHQPGGTASRGISPGSGEKQGRGVKLMEIPFEIFTYIAIVLLLILFLSAAIKVLREYERAVIFTLGRYTGVRGPGLILLIPYIQQMVRVDLRVVVLDVPSQDVISRDNVSVKVSAVIYARVIEADKATIQVENYLQATSELAQTTLRSV